MSILTIPWRQNPIHTIACDFAGIAFAIGTLARANNATDAARISVVLILDDEQAWSDYGLMMRLVDGAVGIMNSHRQCCCWIVSHPLFTLFNVRPNDTLAPTKMLRLDFTELVDPTKMQKSYAAQTSDPCLREQESS